MPSEEPTAQFGCHLLCSVSSSHVEAGSSVSAPTHISRLPVEVLLHIFEQTSLYPFDEDPLMHSKSLDSSRLALSHVCSWWRRIVINHRVLWASIPYRSKNGLATPLEWIWLCLRRSGRQDLHLAIDFTCPSVFSAHGSIHNLDKNYCAHLIAYLVLMKNDMGRVRRFSVSTPTEEHLLQLIIPNAPFPRLGRLLLSIDGRMRTADAMILSSVCELDICASTMRRTLLASLLAQSPSLRHLSLRMHHGPQICELGHSAQPALCAPRLQSLHLRGCVLPARAFHAPELKELLSSPHPRMGRSANWWETDYLEVGTADHHEEVALGHFPQLRQLAIATWWHEIDYLEPSIRLIRAHPDINELRLYGHDGACELLKRAFPPIPLSRSTTNSTSVGGAPVSGTVAKDDVKDDMEWKIRVPTGLHSLVVRSQLGRSDAMLADALRHMLLASSVLRITLLICVREDLASWPGTQGVNYDARDYQDYISLSMKFPGRFSIDSTPLLGSIRECGDASSNVWRQVINTQVNQPQEWE